jgi:ABC-type multidrug transport system ATPase subunit
LRSSHTRDDALHQQAIAGHDGLAEVEPLVAVQQPHGIDRRARDPEASTDRVVERMTGGAIGEQKRRKDNVRGRVLMQVRNLSSSGRFEHVSFDLHASEIVGIAGLLGSGRTELFRCIYGVDRPDSGEVSIVGASGGRRSPRQMIRDGVGFTPESRKKEGLALGLSVTDNLVMSAYDHLARAGWISRVKERRLARASMESLAVKAASERAAVGRLSGGNQQKVVVGKCLNGRARVLLMDEPTRAVDIDAKRQLFALMRQLADAGKGLIFVSSELEELLLVCDRILVLHHGHLVRTRAPPTSTSIASWHWPWKEHHHERAAARTASAGTALWQPRPRRPRPSRIAHGAPGAMRARFGVPSFIVTLALFSALRGLALLITDAIPVSIENESFANWGSGDWLGIPIPGVLLIVTFVLFWLIANRTTFGRSVYAIGGNAEAAYLSGIPVARVRVILFGMTGCLAAITGVLQTAELGAGNPNIGTGVEFSVISAVIVGAIDRAVLAAAARRQLCGHLPVDDLRRRSRSQARQHPGPTLPRLVFFAADGECSLREIAEAVGRLLRVPVGTWSVYDAEAVWGFEAAHFAFGSNSRVRALNARQLLEWQPRAGGLIDDIERCAEPQLR